MITIMIPELLFVISILLMNFLANILKLDKTYSKISLNNKIIQEINLCTYCNTTAKLACDAHIDNLEKMFINLIKNNSVSDYNQILKYLENKDWKNLPEVNKYDYNFIQELYNILQQQRTHASK